MELETLIAQITEEVYSRIQGQGAAQTAGAGDLAGYLEYTLINPRIRIDEIRQMCNVAKQKKYVCVCVPQWFVAYAKELLAGTDVKVCTSIGLPGGNSSTPSKYAEAKMAVENGADEVDIPVNMALVEENDLEAVKRDMQEAMIPAYGKAAVKAVVETGKISQERLGQVIHVLKQCSVDYVVLSNIIGGRTYGADDIKNVVRLCGENMKVKVLGDVKNAEKARSVLSTGAQRIGTSAAEAIA